jgi:hypothetical protein
MNQKLTSPGVDQELDIDFAAISTITSLVVLGMFFVIILNQ